MNRFVRHVAAAARREVGRIVARPLYPLMALALPAISFVVLVGTFRAGVPAKLPVAVVDLDRTPLSRAVARSLAATRTIDATSVPDMAAAERSVRRGEAYAVVALPERMERDVLRGKTATIVCHGEAQYILPYSLIRRAARQTVGDAAARLEFRWRAARGQSAAAARSGLEPVPVELHTLFNPSISYVPYFLSTVLPAMLQVFVVMMFADVFGSEIKERSGAAFLDAARGSLPAALLGKALPHLGLFSVLAAAMLSVLFGSLGVPLRGSVPLVIAASALFVLACAAVALLFVAFTADLRTATSLAAIYSAPAFAFSGSAFPTVGMPLFARIWSALLPLSHFVRLLVQQASRGAAPAASAGTCAALAAFVAAGLVFGAPRYGRLLRDPRFRAA